MHADGVVRLFPGPDLFEEARALSDDVALAAGSTGYFDGDPVPGFVGELALAGWLESQGVPFVRNGGLDDLPDFEIAGVPLALKTRSIESRYLRSIYCAVPDQHRDRPTPWLGFAALVDYTELRLLGTIRTVNFWTIAESSSTLSCRVHNPYHFVDPGALDPFGLWVRRRSRVAA